MPSDSPDQSFPPHRRAGLKPALASAAVIAALGATPAYAQTYVDVIEPAVGAAQSGEGDNGGPSPGSGGDGEPVGASAGSGDVEKVSQAPPPVVEPEVSNPEKTAEAHPARPEKPSPPQVEAQQPKVDKPDKPSVPQAPKQVEGQKPKPDKPSVPQAPKQVEGQKPKPDKSPSPQAPKTGKSPEPNRDTPAPDSLRSGDPLPATPKPTTPDRPKQEERSGDSDDDKPRSERPRQKPDRDSDDDKPRIERPRQKPNSPKPPRDESRDDDDDRGNGGGGGSEDNGGRPSPPVYSIPEPPSSSDPESDRPPVAPVGGLIDMADRSSGGSSDRQRESPSLSGAHTDSRGSQRGNSAGGGSSDAGAGGGGGGWRENAGGGRTYTVSDGTSTGEVRVPDGVFGALPDAGASARVEVLGASEEGRGSGAQRGKSKEQRGEVTRVLARPLAAIDEVTGGRFDPGLVLAALAAMAIGLGAVIRRELPRW